MSSYNMYSTNIPFVSAVEWDNISDKERRVFNVISDMADNSDHQIHHLGACICFQGENLFWLQPE